MTTETLEDDTLTGEVGIAELWGVADVLKEEKRDTTTESNDITDFILINDNSSANSPLPYDIINADQTLTTKPQDTTANESDKLIIIKQINRLKNQINNINNNYKSLQLYNINS